MKRIALIPIFTALSLSFTAAAQIAPQSDTVTITPGAERISLPRHPYAISPGEYEEVSGAYDMANGKTLVMRMAGHRMFAELEGLPKAELVAVSPTTFVAKNRQMKMRFQQEPNGDVSGVTLTYVVRAS
jgi:hypothetical protein